MRPRRVEHSGWSWSKVGEGLLLLFAGAALSALVIPWINQRRAREELRMSKRIEMAQRNTAVNSRLNLVLTELEAFYKDYPTPTDAEREVLVRQLNTLYRDFDSIAWWWHEEMLAHARISGLMPPEREPAARAAIERYKSTLLASVGAIDKLRTAVSRPPYHPRDQELEALIRSTRATAEKLQQQRDAAAYDMIRQVYGE